MKKALLTPVLFLFCACLFAQVSSFEKQALVDFYIATNGEKWSNTWDINDPVSEWQGVTVEDNKVTGISLLFNNIEGNIPPSFGQLEYLKVLELAFNKLNGEIPSELGNLKYLEKLSFNGNDLSGSLPASLGNLSNLKQLHLSSNRLSGEIPASFNNLDKIEVFNVFDNDLSGELPKTLAGNRNLRELMVAENNFTNSEIFSVILLSNSGGVDLNQSNFNPSAKSVIAIETSDDEN